MEWNGVGRVAFRLVSCSVAELKRGHERQSEIQSPATMKQRRALSVCRAHRLVWHCQDTEGFCRYSLTPICFFQHACARNSRIDNRGLG